VVLQDGRNCNNLIPDRQWLKAIHRARCVGGEYHSPPAIGGIEMDFINFTNHPFNKWSDEQKEATKIYGSVIDMPFPCVDPTATESDIERMGDAIVDKIETMNTKAVLCQGEFSLSYYVIQTLQAKNITVLCACSERKVIESVDTNGQAIKTSYFQFVQFKKYSMST